MRSNSICIWGLLSLCSLISFSKESLGQINDLDSSRPQWTQVIKWEWPGSTGYSPVITSMVKYNDRIYVSRRDGIYIINKETNSFKSSHNGLNLKNQSDSAFTKLVVHKNQLFAANLFTGIYRLDDKSKMWVHLNSNPLDTTLFDLVSCNGALYGLSSSYGLFVWNEKSSDWLSVKGDMSGPLWSCGCLDSILWVGNRLNQLFRLNPKTKELKKIIQFGKPDLYQNAIIGFGITSINNAGDTILATCPPNGIYRSTDKGKSWSINPIKIVATAMYNFKDKIFFVNTLGSNDGLFLINPDTNEHQKLELGLQNQYISYMTCIDESVYINNLHGVWEISSEDFHKYYLK